MLPRYRVHRRGKKNGGRNPLRVVLNGERNSAKEESIWIVEIVAAEERTSNGAFARFAATATWRGGGEKEEASDNRYALF